MHHGGDHFKMCQFFGADVGEQSFELRIRHGIALAQVAQRRAHLSIRAAVLTDDDFGVFWIGTGDFDRVLQFFSYSHMGQPSLQ